jgi:hypothetical protein
MARKKKSKEIEAEQAKRAAYEKAVFRLPSTYSLVTAERLLAKLGVLLSQDIISLQIQRPKSYYHALMYVPAKRINIAVLTDRCRDIQSYGQQKLIHYLFSGEASKPETEPGQSMRENLEEDRQIIVEMAKKFNDWEEAATERSTHVFNELQERALAWMRTVEMVAQEATEYLAGLNIIIDEGFSNSLKYHLAESSVKLKLSETLKTNLKLPEQVGMVEKSVICLAESFNKLDFFDKSSLKSMRPTFEALDKKLQSDFDSLTGFNQEGNQQALMDEEMITQMTQQFEDKIAKVAKNLFNYYKEYATSQDLRVSAQEAFDLGVDATVADDYRALHN